MKQLDEYLSTVVLDDRLKGIPLGAALRLGELSSQGWDVTTGDLALPVTTLREEAIENNLRVMAEYCRANGVWLAPHGKTTMAPQLFRRQLEAGAWAICAATPTQAAVMQRFGVPRVLLANELVETDAIRWFGRCVEEQSGEFMCLVDDPRVVESMDRALDGVLLSRRLDVLLELGLAGGRSGARTAAAAEAVARAVAASRHLRLLGVESYEALAARGGVSDEELLAVDQLLETMRQVVTELCAKGLLSEDPIVTAGGSIYFDRVVRVLRDWDQGSVRPQLVLRSGGYISHDGGRAQRLSPLDGRRPAGQPDKLMNAIETWAAVLSCPEPGTVIIGAGKRDLAFDVDLPVPVRVHRQDGSRFELRGCRVTKLMDQHAFMSMEEDNNVRPGDIVMFTSSHPCAVFERSRALPVLDRDGLVKDCVLTFF